MDLITLADLPELAGSAAKPRATIAIGRLDDDLRDPRYGKFAITQRQVDGWKRNLAETFGGQVAIDFDHSSDRGNGTRAAAWIRSIDQTGRTNGSLITADVEFSKRGARSVRNGDYKYTSPTFVENYTDEHGVKHGPALIGAALTNRPVLRKGMPTLSLSRDEFPGVQLATRSAKRERKRAREPAAARDSRGQMDKLAEIRKLLDLDEDADQGAILLAAAALKPPANDSSDGDANDGTPAKASKKAKKKGAKRTLAIDEDGHVLLSAEDYSALLTGANAGQAAATQLAEQTFTVAWEKALSEGRAAPSQEDTLRALHAKDPELAIQTLDSFVKIVPTRPAGSGEGGASTQAPENMEQGRYDLHTKAKALAAEKRRADPTLDEGEAYTMSLFEIEERQFELANPGI